jgi:DNA repair exonuclease SbcCD ATPase subunit
MKLKLVNFGTWRDNEFDFSDNGLVLLCGPSGIGKSTILRAIAFALYNKGTRLVSDGQKSCSVTIELPGIRIYRSKGPIDFSVTHCGEIMSGETAQTFINDKFGNLDNFYLAQKGVNSFVNMSCSSKLEFLQSLAFNNQINQYRDIMKNDVRYIHTAITECEARLQLLRSTSRSIPARPDTDLTDSTLVDRAIVDIQAELRLLDTQQVSISLQLSDARKYAELTNKLDSLEQVKTSLQAQMSSIDCGDDPISNIAILEKSFELANYKKWLNEATSIRDKSVASSESQLTELVAKTRIIQDEIIAIVGTKPVDVTDNQLSDIARMFVERGQKQVKYTELERYIQTTRVVSSDIHNALANELSHLQVSIDMCDRIMECPECAVSLVQVDGKLEKSGIENAAKKLELKEQYQELSTIYADSELAIRKMANAKNEANEIFQRMNEIDTEFDKVKCTEWAGLATLVFEKRRELQSLNSFITRLNGQIAKLMQNPDIPHLENKINELTKSGITEIVDCQAKLADLKSRMKLVDELQHQLKSTNSQISDIKSQLPSEPLDHSLLELNLSKINEAVRLGTTHLAHLYSIKQYFELVNYESTRLANIEEDEKLLKELQLQLSKYDTLATKVNDAEFKCLAGKIEELNGSVQDCLDAFFVDGSMTARVSLISSKGKAEKYKTNIIVTCKNREMDISSLSGGEYDRIVLAFMLSTASMTGCKMILLDEVIGSLDSENAQIVVEYIQRNTDNTLVLLIAHQLVSGGFDSIVDLSN